MIALLLIIPAACLVCMWAGFEIGRTVEYFACQRDRDRRAP